MAPDSVPARNPMVVEVPRYRLAEPNPAALPGAGSGGATGASDRASTSGERAGPGGPPGTPSPGGSVLGLGAPAPALLPLPAASAPASAAAKALNLNLPRVEVYRTPPAGRQLSLSEMANAQLRRGNPRDPLAQGMEDAAHPDCMKPGRDQVAAGLLAAPVVAYNALTGKCR